MPFRLTAAVAAALAAVILTPLPAAAQDKNGQSPGLKLILPAVDSERGRQLFITKGCVYCHAVNGVGGKAAPALDSDSAEPSVNLTDFAARMWRGAPAMIELQEMDLGYQIQLTGDELAHLAGFAHDPAEQKKLLEDQVPELMREWYLDEVPKAQ
ncbi:MAG: c-type cytochrome [Kiloniellales bacterium]|nr:c-type cytochrome [Kiloniellales bacterium]MDJ0969621.1 c-type cytochrome [Kiloniellales bacterium]